MVGLAAPAAVWHPSGRPIGGGTTTTLIHHEPQPIMFRLHRSEGRVRAEPGSMLFAAGLAAVVDVTALAALSEPVAQWLPPRRSSGASRTSPGMSSRCPGAGTSCGRPRLGRCPVHAVAMARSWCSPALSSAPSCSCPPHAERGARPTAWRRWRRRRAGREGVRSPRVRGATGRAGGCRRRARRSPGRPG